MTILVWDKPKKARSSEKHAEMFVADGAPPGTYVPNMSKNDMDKWKAKLVGKTKNVPQVEIRKTCRGSQMLIIINLGTGYNYGYYKSESDQWGRDTKGINIHISMNGPCQMTFSEMDEMKQAIDEATEYLKALK